jgi:toxin ParE1/3/4
VSYRVLFEAGAVFDIETAFEWYEARRTGLGSEFAGSIALAAEALARDPNQYPMTHKPFHWLKLRKFPYAITSASKETLWR